MLLVFQGLLNCDTIDIFLLANSLLCCRIYRSSLGLCPQNAQYQLLSCNHQKYLQTFPNISWKAKLPPGENHGFNSFLKIQNH